jgi:hypothetical protein
MNEFSVSDRADIATDLSMFIVVSADILAYLKLPNGTEISRCLNRQTAAAVICGPL